MSSNNACLRCYKTALGVKLSILIPPDIQPPAPGDKVLKLAQNSLEYFVCGACALEIRSENPAFSDNLVHCDIESIGAFDVAKVAKHQCSRSD